MARPTNVDNRSVGWLEIIGRMKPGITPAAARSDLAVPLDDLTKRYHASRGREDVSVVPLQRELLGETRPALWALLAGVLVLLGVACTNVGGLLLVPSAARAHDLAVRLALGATRRHVVADALAESAVLLAVSGVMGIAVAVGLVGLVRGAAPGNVPGIADVSIDWRVLVFSLTVTAGSIVLCVMASVFQSLSRDVRVSLQHGGRSMAGDGARARRALAATEIALAVVLLMVATLVTRTLLNLRAVEVGYNADRVLAFDVPQPTTRYPDALASLAFADRLLPRLSTLPGVERAASVLLRPLWGVVGMDWAVTIEGQSPTGGHTEPADQSRSDLARLLRDHGDSADRRARHPRFGSCGRGRGGSRQPEFREALLARRPGARTSAAVPASWLSVPPAVVYGRRDRR